MDCGKLCNGDQEVNLLTKVITDNMIYQPWDIVVMYIEYFSNFRRVGLF